MNCDCIVIINDESRRQDIALLRDAAKYINKEMTDSELFAEVVVKSNIEADLYDSYDNDGLEPVGKIHKGDICLCVSGKYHCMVEDLRWMAEYGDDDMIDELENPLDGILVCWAPAFYNNETAWTDVEQTTTEQADLIQSIYEALYEEFEDIPDWIVRYQACKHLDMAKTREALIEERKS